MTMPYPCVHLDHLGWCVERFPKAAFLFHFFQSSHVLVFPTRVTLMLFHSRPFLVSFGRAKGSGQSSFLVVGKVNT